MKPLLLLGLAALLLGCAPKQAPYTSTVGATFVDNPSDGLVTVQSDGLGRNARDAEADAIDRAFTAILFRGLPKFSALSRPLVTSERDFLNANPGFRDGFFAGGGYRRFLSEEWPATEKSQPGEKRVSKKMTINYAALRRHLEEEGMIRKFGYKK